MAIPDFTGWIPVRLYWRQSEVWVDWCYLGDRRLTDPFFDQTIQSALGHPFNLAFRRQTPLELLAELENRRPSLVPSGFIFHMSRCGSTLVAQMLASLPRNVVISEASLMETLFRQDFPYLGFDDADRIDWLRRIVGALGRPGKAQEEHLFIKFDSWHTVHLPLIQRAFPDTPWIFLYRDPVEVLVSLNRTGGRRLIPGAVDPAVLGLDMAEAFSLPAPEYHARILARICDEALACYQPGKTLFLNYREIPQAVWTRLPVHFRFNCGEAEEECMRERAAFAGKGPGSPFRNDSASKRRAAGDAIREAANRWVEPRCRRMAAIHSGRDR